jgi:hypothetical protein
VLVLSCWAKFPSNLISSRSNFHSLLVMFRASGSAARAFLGHGVFSSFFGQAFTSCFVLLISFRGRFQFLAQDVLTSSDLVFLLLGALPFVSLWLSYCVCLPQSALAWFTARDFTYSPECPRPGPCFYGVSRRARPWCLPSAIAFVSSACSFWLLVPCGVLPPFSSLRPEHRTSAFRFWSPGFIFPTFFSPCVNPVQRGQLL